MARKGVTAIISMVLMMLLVIAVFAGVYYWVKNFQEKTQKDTEAGAGKTVKEASGAVKYAFSIVSISDDGSGNIKVTLRNDGSADIRLADVQKMTITLDGVAVGSNDLLTMTAIGTDQLWNQGEMFSFTLDNPPAWSSLVDGETHTFKFELGNLGSSRTYTCGPLDPGAKSCNA